MFVFRVCHYRKREEEEEGGGGGCCTQPAGAGQERKGVKGAKWTVRRRKAGVY